MCTYNSSLQSPPGNNYEKRTDAGKTVSEFNAHLKKQISDVGSAGAALPRVELKAPFPDRNLPSKNFSYMYTPLFQRAIALDEQLVEYEELVKEHYKLEELQAVADPTPAQVTVVGRIVCEAAEGKLNSSVVQLEGSRKTCGGQRVLLDLSSVPNLQIFPGKVRYTVIKMMIVRRNADFCTGVLAYLFRSSHWKASLRMRETR